MDTLKIIDSIEHLVENSSKFLGFVRMDEDRFFQLTSKLRASLPEDVRRAGRLAEDTDRIREAAQGEAEGFKEGAKADAERMLDAARAEADRLHNAAQAEAQRAIDEARGISQSLTDQSEIARIATAQAREIIAQAEAEAEKTRAGADAYARDVLCALESQIQHAMGQVETHANALLNTIQHGREQLEKTAPLPGSVTLSAPRHEPARERERELVGGRR